MNFWDDKSNIFNNLNNMSKYFHQKYWDFFNIYNTDWLASHQAADHAIELKSDIKSSYMHTYNMFSAELKTLDNYLNNILIKRWIHKSQNSADISILFILWKSDKLHLCINYHELNIIIIKNHYSLLLASKLLNWLDSFIIFSKINLWNIYHRIYIYEDDKWKTAFYTWYRYFEYQVISFDLINILIIFQIYINYALHELVNDFYVIYLDNILIFFKIKEEHYKHLKLIIECL